MIHPDVKYVDWFLNEAWQAFVVEQRDWDLYMRALLNSALPE